MKSDQEIAQADDLFVDDAGILNLVTLGVIREPESNARQAELIQREPASSFVRLAKAEV